MWGPQGSLIHLLSHILWRQESWLYRWSIAVTVMFASMCPSPLKILQSSSAWCQNDGCWSWTTTTSHDQQPSFDITQRRIEESPVVEHFNGEGHILADMTVMVIDQLYSHGSCLRKMGKQVDQNPGDLTSFRNEPEGGFSVKPARWLSVDPLEFYELDWYQGYWLSQEVIIMY